MCYVNLCPLVVRRRNLRIRIEGFAGNGHKFGFEHFWILKWLLSSHEVCCVDTCGNKPAKRAQIPAKRVQIPATRANTRKTSSNPNHAVCCILQDARIHQTSVFGEHELVEPWGEHSWPEHVFFVTQMCVTMESPGGKILMNFLGVVFTGHHQPATTLQLSVRSACRTIGCFRWKPVLGLL